MNRTANRNPMSDMGCQTQLPNWRFEGYVSPAPTAVRLRFWVALLAVVLWAVIR